LPLKYSFPCGLADRLILVILKTLEVECLEYMEGMEEMLDKGVDYNKVDLLFNSLSYFYF